MPASARRRKRSVPVAPPEALADFSPLLSERHVALAVSGGSDSMALLRLAVEWSSSHHPGLLLSVLTVDHGLRTASAEEAAMVGRWASALGIHHHVLRWEGPKPETGLQARARAARYRLLTCWCKSEGAGLLLTGHTQDDQAETVLMRLSRTLSPESLAGIPLHGAWDEVPLFRPLLGATRAALRAHLSGIGQGWVDDPSNADPRFERVRVRTSLVTRESPGITRERLAALAEASARTATLLERCARTWMSRHVQEDMAGVCHVPGEAFNVLPSALRMRILAHVIRHFGGGGQPEADELRRLLEWLAAGPGQGAPRCTLGGALLGLRRRGFWITREAGRIDPRPLIVPESGTALWDARFRITAPPGARVTAAGARPVAVEGDVPAPARRSYPHVDLPPGVGGPVAVAFLPLACR